jgi:hypothetical protein
MGEVQITGHSNWHVTLCWTERHKPPAKSVGNLHITEGVALRGKKVIGIEFRTKLMEDT